ncbi:sulfoxide reductase heme-binding subunit YedZ [Pelagibaculum spongiae]|uniref:Protein-methionine-sulfoxide reductase heme-binding subunit MsrQ n=2 Tax=Pelagibaculum spongiae TaxID=2080658 RepID=A0A2V1H6R5_9GAMM|nr:sulfoxide reductase heme-binding subunit YedZ [Pelagibaculum spongiae]
MLKNQHIKIIKPLIFLVALLPLAMVAQGIYMRTLVNPLEGIIHTSGEWALRFLLITLAMTPLKEITGSAHWIKFRRMTGLYALFYASLHFMAWIGLDQLFIVEEIIESIIDRPYILFGTTALLLMIPLGVTSTKGMIRKLGKRWKKLHQLVYPIAILGVVHFVLLVKKDLTEPLIYAAILLALLGWRARLRVAKIRKRHV